MVGGVWVCLCMLSLRHVIFASGVKFIEVWHSLKRLMVLKRALRVTFLQTFDNAGTVKFEHREICDLSWTLFLSLILLCFPVLHQAPPGGLSSCPTAHQSGFCSSDSCSRTSSFSSMDFHQIEIKLFFVKSCVVLWEGCLFFWVWFGLVFCGGR